MWVEVRNKIFNLSHIKCFESKPSIVNFLIPEISNFLKGSGKKDLDLIDRRACTYVFLRYKSYEQIAAVSSGQVYQFSKQNVNQMVEYLESAIQAHKVHLLTTLNDDGSPTTWKMPFDSLLQEVTISIAGKINNRGGYE